jgi:hypothetical protein
MKYLKEKLGVKNFAKSSLRQCGIPKPCFHPNGSLLFVKGKTVQMIPTKKVDQEVKAPYQPANILHKHMRIDHDEKLDE